MNTTRKEINTIDLQIIGSFMFIGVLILSILLNYDAKMKILGKERLFTDKEASTLIIINKIISFLIISLFLYTSLKSYDIAKEKKANLDAFEIINIASILAVIAAMLVVYGTILGIKNDETLPGTGNPAI